MCQSWSSFRSKKERKVDEKSAITQVEQRYNVKRTVEKIWDDNKNIKGFNPKYIEATKTTKVDETPTIKIGKNKIKS